MEKIDGAYLRQLREERGYSLRAFADKIYASKSSVQRWEQSFVPENEEVLQKIAEALDVSVEQMRKESAERREREKDALFTQEQLAEMKFGTRWLVILFCLLPAMIFIFIVLMILFLT